MSDYNEKRIKLIKQLEALNFQAERDGYKLENDIYIKGKIIHVAELYNYSVGTYEDYGYFNIVRQTILISEEQAEKFLEIDLTPYNWKDKLDNKGTDEMDELFTLLSEVCGNKLAPFLENLEHHAQLEFCYSDKLWQIEKDEIEDQVDNCDLEKAYFDMKFEQGGSGFTSHGYISIFSIQKNNYKILPDIDEHFSKKIKDN